MNEPIDAEEVLMLRQALLELAQALRVQADALQVQRTNNAAMSRQIAYLCHLVLTDDRDGLEQSLQRMATTYQRLQQASARSLDSHRSIH